MLEIGMFDICNFNGKTITSFKTTGHSGIKIIDIQNWQSGTHFVYLKTDSKILQTEKTTKY